MIETVMRSVMHKPRSEEDTIDLHSFDRCLNLECKLEETSNLLLIFDFPVDSDDILFAKDLQAR